MTLPSPADLAAVPAEEIPAVMAQLAALQAALAVRLLEDRRDPESASQLIQIADAAAKLDCTVDWLYRHADEFAFTRRVSPKQLRFDLRGLERYLSDGRKAA